jgi:hypothetical protein
MSANKPNNKPAAKNPAPQPAPVASAKPAPAAAAKPAHNTLEAKPAAVTREAIERAAYFRWLTQGGDAETNWHAAEQNLLNQHRQG